MSFATLEVEYTKFRQHVGLSFLRRLSRDRAKSMFQTFGYDTCQHVLQELSQFQATSVFQELKACCDIHFQRSKNEQTWQMSCDT